MQIKKLQEKQISELVEIHRTCVTETNSKFYSEPIIKTWLEQINAENVLDQIKDSNWVVAEENEKILGFAQYSVKDGFLYQINVRPDIQRKNIGKKLYRYVEKEFIKGKSKKINLNSTLNAKDFYKNLGFQEIGKIRFPLGKQELEMVEMVKKL